MAKFSGVIGYAIQSETAPGVWEDQIVEKSYRGDFIFNQQRWQQSKAQKEPDLPEDNNVYNQLLIDQTYSSSRGRPSG